ncbi:hypothetical protein BGZ76_007261 [Entomortierella beljakovae]|nr:hypothetical protein BGZ76_007261 [Entomortierella beljakovae]
MDSNKVHNDNKGYYAAQPPQYPQQAYPAYGQPNYGEAASYQPGVAPQPSQGYGYPPTSNQGYYQAQPQSQQQPIVINQQPARPQNSAADDMCFGCALGTCLCCCLDAIF